MSEPTEVPTRGVEAQKLARRRARQVILESMLTTAGVERDAFEELHQESETAIQTRIAQQMADTDAQSAAMRGIVRSEIENWRYAVEHLKTLVPTAAPIQRVLLDTAADVTATPGLSLDSTQIAPTNNSAKFFLLSSTDAGTTEAVSFGFAWQNASDRPAVVNVDGYLVLDGTCQAAAFGGSFGGYRLCHMLVDASLNIREMWNQPPTSPIRQGGQDARALPSRLTLADFLDDTEIVTRYLFRGFDLQHAQLMVPPDGTVRIEVSCTLTCFHSDGEARFIFNKDGHVLVYGVLIGVLLSWLGPATSSPSAVFKAMQGAPAGIRLIRRSFRCASVATSCYFEHPGPRRRVGRNVFGWRCIRALHGPMESRARPPAGEVCLGSRRRCRLGRRIGNRRSNCGCRRSCPVQSDDRDRSRGAVCCLRPGPSSRRSDPVRGGRCPAASVRQWKRLHALPSGAQLHPGSGESVGRDDSGDATRRYRGGSRVGLRTGCGDVARILGRSDCAQSCDGCAGRTAHAALSQGRTSRVLARTRAAGCCGRDAHGIQTRFVSFDDYWSPCLEKQVPAASPSLHYPQASATSFDSGCAGSYSATALIARSDLRLVRGPCGAASFDVWLGGMSVCA